MTDKQPTFYGDPNMLMRLSETDYLSNRTKNALTKAKKIYLADILQYPQVWLCRTLGFGPKAFTEVLTMLQDMSDETVTYELPKEETDFNMLFNGNKDKIEEYYGLGNAQPNPMQGFAASDFKVASMHITDDHKLEVEITIPEAFANLIDDDLVYFDDHTAPEGDTEDYMPFLQHCAADNLSYGVDTITIIYAENNGGYDRAAKVNILKGFAKAVNEVMPRAQQRALNGIEKRYGIKPPKNG